MPVAGGDGGGGKITIPKRVGGGRAFAETPLLASRPHCQLDFLYNTTAIFKYSSRSADTSLHTQSII